MGLVRMDVVRPDVVFPSRAPTSQPTETAATSNAFPATAKAAEESGLHVYVMAPEASSDALVDALAAHGLGLAIASQEAGEPVRRPSETRSTARRRAR